MPINRRNLLRSRVTPSFTFFLTFFLTIWTFFILLFPVNQIQAQVLDKPISLHIKNKPLQEALKTISEAGNINFSYNPQSIPADKTISISCDKKPLREVLDIILKPLGITYIEIENQVEIGRAHV